MKEYLSELNLSPSKVKQFENKKIYTVSDLLHFLPKKYYDFRNPTSANNVENEELCSMILQATDLDIKPKYVKLKCIEKTSNRKVEVIWFNQKFITNIIKDTDLRQILVCGKININPVYQSITFINPIIFTDKITDNTRIYPVYSKIKGMSEQFLQKTISDILSSETGINETIPVKAKKEFKLIDEDKAIKAIHFPENEKELKEAKRKLIFDDVYYFAKSLIEAQKNENNISSINITKSEITEKLISELPYDLTEDQKNTINNIIEKMKKGERVNALVQGDVGCGKSIIAFCLMMIIAENGYQSAIMAPTGVLALQHYNELTEYAEKYGFKTIYLSGEMTIFQKKKAIEKIEKGEVQLIVGTHSLISDTVEFENLGLVIVDEEHKFGTAQRKAIRDKAKMGVHSVTMSATPIPRTLAITLYGNNLSLYSIVTMPAGRKPIKTAISRTDKATFEFIEKVISEKHQCYIVCPLITESEYEGMANVESVEQVARKLDMYFKSKLIPAEIGILTGKMKKSEVKEIIERFKKNEIQILISTTVVEVGVNVPNATLMVIRNAERFGMASLHQLRGRVGRGKDQAFCILNSEDVDNERLKTLVNTTNGYEIAQADLNMRGAGDFIGTKQTGYNKYVMLMLAFPKLYKAITEWIRNNS